MTTTSTPPALGLAFVPTLAPEQLERMFPGRLIAGVGHGCRPGWTRSVAGSTHR